MPRRPVSDPNAIRSPRKTTSFNTSSVSSPARMEDMSACVSIVLLLKPGSAASINDLGEMTYTDGSRLFASSRRNGPRTRTRRWSGVAQSKTTLQPVVVFQAARLLSLVGLHLDGRLAGPRQAPVTPACSRRFGGGLIAALGEWHGSRDRARRRSLRSVSREFRCGGRPRRTMPSGRCRSPAGEDVRPARPPLDRGTP